MADFALELDSYVPAPYKHITSSEYILITNPHQYNKAVESLTENGVIGCRTITGHESTCTKCVGFCWNEVHRGYHLTKKQMDQHQCLEKSCHRFEKIESAPYWSQQVAKNKTAKTENKQKNNLQTKLKNFLQKSVS